MSTLSTEGTRLALLPFDILDRIFGMIANDAATRINRVIRGTLARLRVYNDPRFHGSAVERRPRAVRFAAAIMGNPFIQG